MRVAIKLLAFQILTTLPSTSRPPRQDLFAMGARPAAALALAVVPHTSDSIQEEDLFQMMAGAAEVLGAEGCALAGGHTCEGAELALGESAGAGGGVSQTCGQVVGRW